MAAGDEQDLIEAVVTCEGNLHDPDFQDKFRTLVDSLKSALYISKTKDPFRVRKIEPWNSVRVTISIPKEAAQKLKLLAQQAQQGSNVLRSMGILSVQVEGDQVISLTWAAQNNEATQVILRQTSDEPAGSSGTSGVSSSSLPATSPSVSSISSSVASISSPVPLTPGTSGDTGVMAVTLDMLSSSSSSTLAFRSPNVVAPSGESIPVLPPKTPVASARPVLGGPFPFVSMTHAAQAIQRSELSPLLNSNNIVVSNNNISGSNAANSTNSIASSVPSSSSSSSLQGSSKSVQPSQSNFPVTVTNPTATTSSSDATINVSTSVCNIVTTVNVNSESQVTRLIIENPSDMNLATQMVGNNVASLGISGNSNVALSQAGPSQSLQLQLVNVPPPYPGVNTISSNHSLSSSNSSNHNISILTSNVQSRHQLQTIAKNAGPLTPSPGPSNPNAQTVTMVSPAASSQPVLSRAGAGYSSDVPSAASLPNISDGTSAGVSSLAHPVSSPLLVNLLQNNDLAPSSASNTNTATYNQQQQVTHKSGAGVGGGEGTQHPRFLLQQQHLQQLKKAKRGLSVEGASALPKVASTAPFGESADPVSSVATSNLPKSTNASKPFQFALPLPSESSAMTMNRVSAPIAAEQSKAGSAGPNQIASEQSSTVPGRTIVQGNIRILEQGSGQVRTIPLHKQQPTTTPVPTLASFPGKTVLGTSTTHCQLSLGAEHVTALANGPISPAAALSQSSGSEPIISAESEIKEGKSQKLTTVTLVQPVEQQHSMDRDASRITPTASLVADQSRTLLPITTVNIVSSKSPSKLSSNVNSNNNNNKKDSDSKTFIPPPDPRLSSQVQKLSHGSNSVSVKNSASSNLVVQTASYNSDAKSSASHPAGRAAILMKRTSKERTFQPGQISSPGKPRQFLINPLTGHLEPMPSESSSESEEGDEGGDGESGRKSNSLKGSLHKNKLGRGVPVLPGIHHRQIVTTETGVTVARVLKTSIVDQHLAQPTVDIDGKKLSSQLQIKGALPIPNATDPNVASGVTFGPSMMSLSKKPREESLTTAALHNQKDSKDNNPSPATVTATSVTGEKIKLRLKLEKSEPISPAYKVDVSFVKKSEKSSVAPTSVLSSGTSSSASTATATSSSSGGNVSSLGEQPRVPPLHISLRGKNAAVVVSPRREEKDMPPPNSGISGNTKDPTNVISNKDVGPAENAASQSPQYSRHSTNLINSHEVKLGSSKSSGNVKRTKSKVKSADSASKDNLMTSGAGSEKVGKSKISRPKLSKEVTIGSRLKAVKEPSFSEGVKESKNIVMPVLHPAVILPTAVASIGTLTLEPVDKKASTVVLPAKADKISANADKEIDKPGNKTVTKQAPADKEKESSTSGLTFVTPLPGNSETTTTTCPIICTSDSDLITGEEGQPKPSVEKTVVESNNPATPNSSLELSTEPATPSESKIPVASVEENNSVAVPVPESSFTETTCGEGVSQSHVDKDQLPQIDEVFMGAFSPSVNPNPASVVVGGSEGQPPSFPPMSSDNSPKPSPSQLDSAAKGESFVSPVINLSTDSCDINTTVSSGGESASIEKEEMTGLKITNVSTTTATANDSPASCLEEIKVSDSGATLMEVDESPSLETTEANTIVTEKDVLANDSVNIPACDGTIHNSDEGKLISQDGADISINEVAKSGNRGLETKVEKEGEIVEDMSTITAKNEPNLDSTEPLEPKVEQENASVSTTLEVTNTKSEDSKFAHVDEDPVVTIKSEVDTSENMSTDLSKNQSETESCDESFMTASSGDDACGTSGDNADSVYSGTDGALKEEICLPPSNVIEEKLIVSENKNVVSQSMEFIELPESTVCTSDPFSSNKQATEAEDNVDTSNANRGTNIVETDTQPDPSEEEVNSNFSATVPCHVMAVKEGIPSALRAPDSESTSTDEPVETIDKAGSEAEGKSTTVESEVPLESSIAMSSDTDVKNENAEKGAAAPANVDNDKEENSASLQMLKDTSQNQTESSPTFTKEGIRNKSEATESLVPSERLADKTSSRSPDVRSTVSKKLSDNVPKEDQPILEAQQSQSLPVKTEVLKSTATVDQSVVGVAVAPVLQRESTDKTEQGPSKDVPPTNNAKLSPKAGPKTKLPATKATKFKPSTKEPGKSTVSGVSPKGKHGKAQPGKKLTTVNAKRAFERKPIVSTSVLNMVETPPRISISKVKQDPSNIKTSLLAKEIGKTTTSIIQAPQLVPVTSTVPTAVTSQAEGNLPDGLIIGSVEGAGETTATTVSSHLGSPVSVTIMTPKHPDMAVVSTTNTPPISIVLPSESVLRSNNPDGKLLTPKNAYKRRAEIKPGALQNTLKRLHDNLPKVLKTSEAQDASSQASLIISASEVDGMVESPMKVVEVEPSSVVQNSVVGNPNKPVVAGVSSQQSVNIAVSQVRPVPNVLQRSKTSTTTTAASTLQQISSGIQSNLIANMSTVTSATLTSGTTLTVSSSSGGQPQTVFAIHPNVSIPANFAQLQQSPVVLPGGHKMVPIKLVTLPKQSSGQLQTIPIGNATPNRSSPNLLDAVNIVANAGSRSSSPKTTLIGNTMQTTPLNLSSVSLPVGSNLHFVPISVSSATGTTGNVKVIMAQPIKMQQAGLSQSMVVRSVLMGNQPASIRVIRPAHLPEPVAIQTIIKPTPEAATVNEVSKPKIFLTTSETSTTKSEFITLPTESLFKKLDGVEIVETGSPLNNDDLPFEADIIHDEKDLADVLAAEAKNEVNVIENCTSFHVDLKSSKEGESRPNPPSIIASTAVQNHVASKKLLHASREETTKDISPSGRTRTAPPLLSFSSKNAAEGSSISSPSDPDAPDLHGEDEEIINSFSKSTPHQKPTVYRSNDAKSTSEILPDHTYGMTSAGLNLDSGDSRVNLAQELSIEIPPVDLEGTSLSPSQNPPEEKRCTRSTRSNTRLSPDITAFSEKAAKAPLKVDSATLKNSPKPSPTGSLKMLSPTPSSLTITPSTSTRSSPILQNQHQGNVGNPAAALNAVALGIIDKIQGNATAQNLKNSRISKLSGGGKRKRQESDSSSASRDENLEEKMEIDLNSRPGKRKCSENAAEMIKVCIGVEDSPKRNSSSVKKTDDAKAKDGKGKRGLATVVEDDDDVDSEVSLSRGRSGRSSRESSEDRSSSRGSSAQRVVTTTEKPKSAKEEEPTKELKSGRLNNRLGKDGGAKAKNQSGRVSPNQSATSAKKVKDSGKAVTRRLNRPIAKDKSPLTPAKTRTNVRKDTLASQTTVDKSAASTPSQAATPETENARRKTRSSAAGKRHAP